MASVSLNKPFASWAKRSKDKDGGSVREKAQLCRLWGIPEAVLRHANPEGGVW